MHSQKAGRRKRDELEGKETNKKVLDSKYIYPFLYVKRNLFCDYLITIRRELHLLLSLAFRLDIICVIIKLSCCVLSMFLARFLIQTMVLREAAKKLFFF